MWKTDERIAVRPYYRAEHAEAREPLDRAAAAWEMVPAGEDRPVAVNAVGHHEAGGTAVHELAFALAEGVERLAGGQAVDSFAFAIGSNHFMEIAKLRALRLLWAQVEAAFGRPASPIRIHARTAGANKTLFDPYVNMLRVTTEALSAVLGGCDSLDDHALRLRPAPRGERPPHPARGKPPGQGARPRRRLVLRRGPHRQPRARGVGALQRIEAAGGLAAWRASGALDAALAESREAKAKAVAARRRVLVGTNNYPDVGERRLDDAAGLPGGWRLASALEAVRLRTERHARATGRTPRVLLLERGDLKMRKARAAFCLNFFGCGGFDVVQGDTLGDADLVVLCSADAEYLALAREVCPQAKAPVVVAGNPKDHVEALRAAGVADFVHVGSNAVDTLAAWQQRLGIGDWR